MSLKKLLNSIMESVIIFIDHILPSTKHLLDASLNVVTLINNFNNSRFTDVFVAITPWKEDDIAHIILQRELPRIMVGLKLASDEAGKTPEQIVLDGIKAIQGMDHDIKSVTLQSLFQLIGNAVTDDAVKLSDLQKIGQSLYEESQKQ